MRRFNPNARTNPNHAQPVRIIDAPQPGWFRMRLVKGGPTVPARIAYGPQRDPETGLELDRSWLWHGEINGQPDPNPTPAPTETVMRIWTSGAPITEAEHDYLAADRAWAAEFAPHLPEANPTRRIDLSALDPRDLF